MNSKANLFIKILLLVIVDFIIIWFLVNQIHPDPSVSIAIALLVPPTIIANLIIALIFYFIDKKYTLLFAINSVIAAVLMNYLFSNAIARTQRERLESWHFKISNTNYEIIHWKLDSTFSMSRSDSPSTSMGFLDGKFIKRGGAYYLTTDSTEYVMKGDYLYEFTNSVDSLKLVKDDR